MIPDARPYLLAARDTYTDPVEVAALVEYLAANETVSAALSLVSGKVVWLFAGPRSQIAIPVELVPQMTAAAREGGIFAAFLDALQAEMEETYETVRKVLFPEGP